MNRKTTTLVTAMAAATALAGTAALETGSASAAGDGYRMSRYVGHDVPGEFAMADLAAPHAGEPGIGDLMAFTQRLTKGGRTVGRVSNVAVGVDQTRHLFQANGTMVLPDGKVTFAGLVSQGSRFTLAVTGGTGSYRGARGTLAFSFSHGRQILTLRTKS